MEKKNTAGPVVRLNRFIAAAGFCSRREADELIVAERVTVNGILATMGMQVSFTDKIRIDGQTLKADDLAMPVRGKHLGRRPESPVPASRISKRKNPLPPKARTADGAKPKTKADAPAGKVPGGRQGRSLWKKSIREEDFGQTVPTRTEGGKNNGGRARIKSDRRKP